jgi:signal transduction histidine kinase/CheY-like chemotaxis protein
MPNLGSSSSPWRILVVDDDEDVQAVTQIALKHRSWQQRKFELVRAMSAAEARAIVTAEGAPRFDVALVDAVMETSTAGLELCTYLRESFPPSLRIVLRTGQPGVAPEEEILNRLDIDFYLAKAEVTADRLYAVLRACLRSSQDISTLVAYANLTKEIVSRQAHDVFSRALHQVSTINDLTLILGEGVKFLELKHDVRTAFIPDAKRPPKDEELWPGAQERIEAVAAAMTRLGEDATLPQVCLAPELDLPKEGFAIPFSVVLEASGEPTRGALYCEPRDVSHVEAAARRLLPDAVLFIDNWKIALNTLHLQERIRRERMIRDLMYKERLEGLATMVAGVAHEINTPLGVANTANSMVKTLIERYRRAEAGSPSADKAYNGLVEASELMTRNISRAHRLIESFKKLSSGQLNDRRGKVDLLAVITDSLESMRPVTGKQEIEITVHAPPERLVWEGYGGQLSQVIINFIQNTARYAYPDVMGGKVDLRLIDDPEKNLFRIEFQDYGKGVAPEVVGHLFEPFVTTGRDRGGTGLGLAITHNIVTNVLGGGVRCDSEVGKGTTFIVELPKVVPDETERAAAAGGRSKPLGALLVEMGAITSAQLERALQKQRSEGGRLGEILVGMRAISEDLLRDALASQARATHG